MIVAIIVAIAFALFWLASKEKPLYRKAYFQTRSDGVFRTDHAPGFREYIAGLDEEVRLRFTVGPFSPTDDLHADLYHPELETNWRRDLSRRRLYEWTRDGLRTALVVAACVAIADLSMRLLTHRTGVLVIFETGATIEQLAAWAFAAAVCTYLMRNRDALSRTQGYLDGYSDRCAGADRTIRTIAPPSPRE